MSGTLAARAPAAPRAGAREATGTDVAPSTGAGMEASERLAGGWKAVFLRALHWAPVWAPLLFLLQVLLLGLFPAIWEHHRLTREQQRLDGKRVELERHHQELLLLQQAQQDPLYLERERRALLVPRTEAGAARTPPAAQAAR